MEITTVEQAKDGVKKWLTENHHEVNEVKDDNANFHFEIDYPLASQKRQRIIQPKEYPGLVVLLNHRTLLYIVSTFNESFGIPTLQSAPIEHEMPGHA